MSKTVTHDVVSILVNDHREIEATFVKLERGRLDPRERRDLTDHVIAELVRHAVTEEQYVYPMARKVLPDGDTVADQEISEHAEAEETMKALDGLDVSDPRFDDLLGELMRVIRHHIAEEEGQLFPRLTKACTADELDRLGEKVLRAKQLAPTRPHPSAPDRPPMNKLLGPGTGLVDRVRDALSGRRT